MSPPTLLTQFLRISCGLSAAETCTLWDCLSAEQRARLRYHVERVCKRRPYTLVGAAEAMRLVTALNPRRLVEALEQAVEAGQLTRQASMPIEEKLFVEMDQDGQWRYRVQ